MGDKEKSIHLSNVHALVFVGKAVPDYLINAVCQGFQGNQGEFKINFQIFSIFINKLHTGSMKGDLNSRDCEASIYFVRFVV